MKPRRLLSLLLLSASAVCLAAWVGGWSVWTLVPAAGGAAGGGALLPRTDHRRLLAASLLVLAVAASFLAEWDLQRFSDRWPERLADWEEEVQEHLARELDRLLRAGEVAAERLARSPVQSPGDAPPSLPDELLEEGVDAVAAFGPEGELLAWQGAHQGPFPRAVRLGQDRYAYVEGALFGYLYVSHPRPGGEGTAVAASLLRADLPTGLAEGLTDFASGFQRRHDARVRVSRPDRVEGESVWQLRWEDRALLSVSIDPLSEADALETRAARWQRAVAGGALLAWLLLLAGSGRTRREQLTLAGGLLLVLGLLPLDRLLGIPEPFSPTGLLLPVSPSVTLGDLLVFGGAGAFLLGALASGRVARLPGWVSAVAGTLAAAAVLMLMGAGASRELLGEGEVGWIAFQGAGTVLSGILFTAAMLLGRGRDRRVRGGVLLLGLGGALLLAVVAVLRVHTGPTLPAWTPIAWTVPLWAVIVAVPTRRRWAAASLRLVLGITLAATLVLPWAWSLRVEARMAGAEERMERLGTRPDPFLEFLLLRAGEEAVELAGTGRNAVEILYGAWIRSGLAEEDVPLWLTVWSPDGRPQEELRIGVTDDRPPLPAELMDQALLRREVSLRRYDLADMHYAAVTALGRGAAISMIVPPRRTLSGRAPLGPLFSPARGDPDPLVLVPLSEGEAPEDTEGVRWIRSSEGWQGEVFLAYPDETYHAHYILELPGAALLVARGTLLLLLSLIPALLLWAGGRRVGPADPEGEPGHWRRWMTSFRGKVTGALFVFFLIPSLAFGTLAYRTLSGAALRSAEALAERAVEDAAGWYDEAEGAMDLLARRTGSDLLLYTGGELVAGSLQEQVELGVYHGWLPWDVHRRMVAGEELVATAAASLGSWEYVVAYRRGRGGQVLAAPAPLQAGATAVRQREVADLLGFTVVLGAGLSVLLSLLVGRALTRPIHTLQVASERVGAGNMGVHLPEDRSDEFGAVFSAFNRMVDRLGRTRRELIRGSRRTRAIVEEVATGIVALDPEGRVILANPRAEELLGARLTANRPLPSGENEGEPVSVLSQWVERYLRDGLREAGTDLQIGARRLRVRARRVSRRGPPGGAVVSVEDVTDELRTERVLAWGEMARQVAHEVKNPLTPIKLGVQHLRRAWEDERADFGDILLRNVEAILREIDRLSAIASGFSRFGAPKPPGSRPAEPVDLARVVDEILALYRAGEGPVRFEARGVEALPPVRARASEVKEVLVNLLENARRALEAGGSVQVVAEVEGGEVEVRVRDDGPGIPEELLHRVFEPHFSTQAGGSGLGLAIVRRLVESWGGRVWAENEAGWGTTVAFTVPIWVEGMSRGADEAP